MSEKNQITPGGTVSPGPAQIFFDQPSKESLQVKLGGDWTISETLPSADEVFQEISSAKTVRQVSFDTAGINDWDSGLVTFLLNIYTFCQKNSINLNTDGLPPGAAKLIALATAVPERKGARRETVRESILARIGISMIDFRQSIAEVLGFIGEAFIALAKLPVGKANFRRSDFFLFIQECGANALPIVTLISLLVGLIFAFVGAVQLVMFGAQIYVADLVAIAMVRVMGAIMVGIIMAGRTGAAFAAQLGTMQVNEEIDALKTLGVSPMEFLVLPRMLALVLMMPLLCVYADLMGIIGGMMVGIGMLDLGVVQYINQTRSALSLTHFWIGLFHATVFGVLIALSGCLRGIQCGRSAAAVGDATTSAVVTSIVAIIVATAMITVVCNIVGI